MSHAALGQIDVWKAEDHLRRVAPVVRRWVRPSYIDDESMPVQSKALRSISAFAVATECTRVDDQPRSHCFRIVKPEGGLVEWIKRRLENRIQGLEEQQPTNHVSGMSDAPLQFRALLMPIVFVLHMPPKHLTRPESGATIGPRMQRAAS